MGEFDKIFQASQKRLDVENIRTINESQANRTANQGGLNKGLGMLGYLHSIPVNLTRNLFGAGKGIKPVSLFNTTTGVSDIFEAHDPNLLHSKSFQDNKLMMDLVTSIGLDPLTYFSGGATATGKTASRLAKLGLAVKLDKAGNVIKQGNKILYQFIKPVEKGVNFKKAFKAGDVLTQADHPKLWKEMNKAKAFDKPLHAPGKTFNERLKQDYTSILSFGPTDTAMNKYSRKATSRIIDNVAGASEFMKNSNAYKALATTLIAQKGGRLVSNFLSSTKTVSNELKGLDVPNSSNMSKSYDEIYNGFDDAMALKQAGINAEDYLEAISKVRMKQAQRAGISVDDYAKTLKNTDKFGMTLDERNTVMNYLEFKDLKAFKTKTGNYVGHTFDVSKGKTQVITKPFANSNPKFLKEYDEVIDLIDKKFVPSNKAQTKGLIDAGLDAGVGVKVTDHHVLGKALNKVEKEFVRSNKFLSSAYKIAKGAQQLWRGFSLASKNAFRKKVHQVITDTSGAFSDDVKKIASLIKDERLAYSQHSINDLFKRYAKLDLGDDDKYKALLSHTRETDPKMGELYMTLKETVERAKKIKTADSINGFKWSDDLMNKPLADVFENVKENSVADFYQMGLPYMDLESKLVYNKQIKRLNFFKSIFVDNLESGVSTITKSGKAEPGFKVLKNVVGAKVPRDQVEELLAKVRTAHVFDPKADYFWSIRDDLWDVLKNDGVLDLIDKPTKTLAQESVGIVNDIYKFFHSTWKQTTLFLFSAYHMRNHIDNVIKSMVEYGGDIVHFRKDYTDAIKILADHTDLPFNSILARSASTADLAGKGGKVNILGTQAGIINRSIMKLFKGTKDPGSFKTYGGTSMTSKQLVDMATKEGVIGDVVTMAGDTKQFGSKLDRRMKVLRESPDKFSQDKSKLVRWFKTEMNKLPTKYSDAMDSGMETSEMIEATSRLQLFKKFLKEMPKDEAIAKVNLVMIDYGQMNKFEREIIGKIMPFYSFKKGIVKYLGTKLKESPVFFQAFRESAEFLEEITQKDETYYNRALMPEWLKEGGIQIKVDEETGEPVIINLKGLTSYAEFLNFTQPVKSIMESLSPFIKVPTQLIANRDFYFNSPIETYEGETKNILGFEVKKRSLTAGALGSIRAVGALQPLVESVLDSKLVKDRIGEKSLFGRRGVKSGFGLGTVSSSKAQPFQSVLYNKILGIPKVNIDMQRQLKFKLKEVQTVRRDYNTSISRMRWRYKGDPKSFLAEKARKDKEFLKKMQHFKDQRLGVKNTSLFFDRTGRNK